MTDTTRQCLKQEQLRVAVVGPDTRISRMLMGILDALG